MSFGQGYANRFMIDFEAGWTEESLREWADTNHYDITPVNDNLRNHQENLGFSERPVLMFYTPVGHDDQNRLNGYFVLRSEAIDVYTPEGWDFISAVPEEIIV